MHEIIPYREVSNNWMISKEPISQENIGNLILESEIVVSDLDNSLGPSVVKRYVESRFVDRPTDIGIIRWGLKSYIHRKEEE